MQIGGRGLCYKSLGLASSALLHIQWSLKKWDKNGFLELILSKLQKYHLCLNTGVHTWPVLIGASYHDPYMIKMVIVTKRAGIIHLYVEKGTEATKSMVLPPFSSPSSSSSTVPSSTFHFSTKFSRSEVSHCPEEKFTVKIQKGREKFKTCYYTLVSAQKKCKHSSFLVHQSWKNGTGNYCVNTFHRHIS